MRRFATATGISIALCIMASSAVFSRDSGELVRERSRDAAAGAPSYCVAGHDIGKIFMSVSNNGTFGINYSASGSRDCFTNDLLFSVEYPKGSRTEYLFGGAFWIGAIVGRDTLASIGQDGWLAGAELHPDGSPFGDMIRRSIIDPSKDEFEDAVSEQDFISVYYDTCLNCSGVVPDPLDGRPHIPLFIEVSQRSYAWSYSYADDFVLFDYAIKNIGHQRLRRVFMGVYVDADVADRGNNSNGFTDDLCGFKETLPALYMPKNCPAIDTVNIAYIIDNDGDFDAPPPFDRTVEHVTGTRIVRTPSDSLQVAFNWWVSNGDSRLDYGPQTQEKFRDLSTGGQGTPHGDRNKYAFLSNGEFDFDQVFTSDISPLDTIWKFPNQIIADDITNGFDTRYLLSFGPFSIDPGQTLPLSLAYVAGEDIHSSTANFQNNVLNSYDPVAYVDGLNFDKLGANATWASWVYDNPGVDTDSDGYFGKFRVCETIVGNDTIREVIWYEGDGVPDFQGATPPCPPSLTLRVEPTVGKVKIRWNGHCSETTVDLFSRKIDFEGYRVWRSRDDRTTSYSLLASYDVEDYNKWVFSSGKSDFVLLDTPFPLDSLRLLYAPGGEFDSSWFPLDYPRNLPFILPGFTDSVFFFNKQDFNQSRLGHEPMSDTDIRKPYPDALTPPFGWTVDTVLERFGGDSNPLSDSLDIYLTEQVITKLGDTLPRYFRFYEYEYTISNLLPTVPYWFNVTAFDFGSPQTKLASLETSVTLLPKVTFALESIDSVAAKDLPVYVYPNPYRLDASYLERGFEGRFGVERSQAPERVRRIHFANLPPVCTIRIHSLDGDLVAEISHSVPISDPLANHDSWDLITRNSQQAVSGIYYWTVETPGGAHQIGKLVIIM